MADKKDSAAGSSGKTEKNIDFVRDVLVGDRRFDELATPVATPIHQSALMALFFRSWERPRHCFVIDPTNADLVRPSLILKFGRGEWQTQPYVTTDLGISRSVGLPLDEQWLRILLNLVSEELTPLLPLQGVGSGDTTEEHVDPDSIDHRPAMQHIENFITGGYRAFLTHSGAHRKWFVASRWPTWMAERYSQDEAAAEVAKEEGLQVYPSDNLRKMLADLGLVWRKRRRGSR